MRIERDRHINATAYERTDMRSGYANGFKPKQLNTRLGALNLQVPQVREGNFYPSFLERGLRSERALCFMGIKLSLIFGTSMIEINQRYMTQLFAVFPNNH